MELEKICIYSPDRLEPYISCPRASAPYGEYGLGH